MHESLSLLDNWKHTNKVRVKRCSRGKYVCTYIERRATRSQRVAAKKVAAKLGSSICRRKYTATFSISVLRSHLKVHLADVIICPYLTSRLTLQVYWLSMECTRRNELGLSLLSATLWLTTDRQHSLYSMLIKVFQSYPLTVWYWRLQFYTGYWRCYADNNTIIPTPRRVIMIGYLLV